MNKTTYLLLAMTVIVVMFASACGAPAAPTTQAAQPPVEVAPTQVPPVEAAPTQPLATVQSFAPACQAAASCAAPDVKDTVASETFCVEKIPYQNISVEPGTTFESLDPNGELKCQDSGTVVDGKSIITCTAKELWTYEKQLKFTNSACAAGALVTDSSQCQAGLGYDAAQNCCAPVTSGDAGSTTITVNMGACPGPQ